MEFTRQRFCRLWIAGALAAFAVLVACSGGESESSSNQTVAVSPSIEQEVGATIATGEPDGAVAPVAGAFRFQLPSASGDTVSLESYVGDKNVALVFYRAFRWVQYREKLVELREGYQKIMGLDAEVLAISTDDLQDAESVVERLVLDFPILYDSGATVVREYGIYDLNHDSLASPSTFVIDKSGEIRWKHIGEGRYDRATNQQIIDALQELS
jgi:peroxiredoxin